MNPLWQAALGSVLRWALTAAAGILVSKGIWSKEDAATYVGAAAVGLLTLGWSLYQKYRDKLLVNTALAMPQGSTVQETKQAIADGKAPAASIPETHAPVLQPATKP